MSIDPVHPAGLSASLKMILDIELNLGNEVIETWSGWQQTHSIGVVLAKPFFRQHEQVGLLFKITNDPHCWKG
jgi:hypothetical protein